MPRNNYSIGNKKGPVMISGTVWKSQKEFNKYFLIGIIIVAILIIFSSTGSSPSYSSGSSSTLYTIEIGGTTGNEFSGSIGGAGSSRTIEGTVPQTYTVYGWPAVAVIQNMEDFGSISVTIKQGETIVDTQSTSASYGVVTASSK